MLVEHHMFWMRARCWEKVSAKGVFYVDRTSHATRSRNTIQSFEEISSSTDVVARRSGPRWFFGHVGRASHVQQVPETQCNHLSDREPSVERTPEHHSQQALEIQCNHSRDYEATVEITSGPRGFSSCWSNITCSTIARNTTHSFISRDTSQTLIEHLNHFKRFRARRC